MITFTGKRSFFFEQIKYFGISACAVKMTRNLTIIKIRGKSVLSQFFYTQNTENTFHLAVFILRFTVIINTPFKLPKLLI